MPPGFTCQPYRLSTAELTRRSIAYNRHIKTGYAHLILTNIIKGIRNE